MPRTQQEKATIAEIDKQAEEVLASGEVPEYLSILKTQVLAGTLVSRRATEALITKKVEAFGRAIREGEREMVNSLCETLGRSEKLKVESKIREIHQRIFEEFRDSIDLKQKPKGTNAKREIYDD